MIHAAILFSPDNGRPLVLGTVADPDILRTLLRRGIDEARQGEDTAEDYLSVLALREKAATFEQILNGLEPELHAVM